MNTIIVSGLIFDKFSFISRSSTSYYPFSFISLRNLQKTQGNKQCIRQLGSIFGALSLATLLQRFLNEVKEESAIIIGA